MKNKKNIKEATAPKEATVAKTAKKAAIDPKIVEKYKDSTNFNHLTNFPK